MTIHCVICRSNSFNFKLTQYSVVKMQESKKKAAISTTDHRGLLLHPDKRLNQLLPLISNYYLFGFKLKRNCRLELYITSDEEQVSRCSCSCSSPAGEISRTDGCCLKRGTEGFAVTGELLWTPNGPNSVVIGAEEDAAISPFLLLKFSTHDRGHEKTFSLPPRWQF